MCKSVNCVASSANILIIIKLNSLCLVSGSRCVTSRFGGLVNMCVEVLHDVMETTKDDVLYE